MHVSEKDAGEMEGEGGGGNKFSEAQPKENNTEMVEDRKER